MPFVSIEVPSIQLGLLKALATRHSFPTINFHFSLDFARQIGLPRYHALANHRGRLYGDWVFAAAAGTDAPGDLIRDFRDEITEHLRELGESPPHALRAIREREVPRYLQRLLQTVDWSKFHVVGFTSTFQQNMASVAMAAEIKRRYPKLVTLFGGANFDGEMGEELVKTFECIDYAVNGPGDEAFITFLDTLAMDRDPTDIPGIVSRRSSTARSANAIALDTLPTPDYDDFFERAEKLEIYDKRTRRTVRLPFESSRGCWWGQKQHCTFCGLNGSDMAFREKTSAKVSDELAELAKRYRTFQFEAVDNIMPTSYLQTLLPNLVREGRTYTIFYETKANLRREHVALLASAGVRVIQPGIESLSTHVLKLMRKGVTAIQNVNLLRWARHYGVRVVWNVLWGFPGETLSDYVAQAELLPKLRHLQPPLSASRIWMERFSPIFSDRDAFPAKEVAPEASYRYVYPQRAKLEKIAYFFEYEFEQALPKSAYIGLQREIECWKQVWHGQPTPPTLTYRSSPEFIEIADRRSPGAVTHYSLTGPLALLYAACIERPRGLSSVLEGSDVAWSPSRCEQAFAELCRQGLMMRDGDLFLSLALPDSDANAA